MGFLFVIFVFFVGYESSAFALDEVHSDES